MIAQGSPEWHAMRLGKVTASRIADMLATNRSGPSAARQGYLGELVAERLTGVSAASTFMNDDMRRGVALEPRARAEYEAYSGLIVGQVPFVDHPSIPRSGASPDGLVGTDGLIEVKCPRIHVHIGYLLAGVPPADYTRQMTWQVACTRRKWVDFVSFCPALPDRLALFVVRFEPLPSMVTAMEAEVVRFQAEIDDTIHRLGVLR